MDSEDFTFLALVPGSFTVNFYLRFGKLVLFLEYCREGSTSLL